MKTAIIKWLAKIVLDNFGTLVVWLIEQGTDRYVHDSDKFKKVLAVTEEVASNTAKIAAVMKDGEISEEESAGLLASVNACAEKIKQLL